MKLGVPIHAVHGNNLGDAMAMHKMMVTSDGLLTYHGQDAALKLGGRRISNHFPIMAETWPEPEMTIRFVAATAMLRPKPPTLI